jgi:hypothetical protein
MSFIQKIMNRCKSGLKRLKIRLKNKSKIHPAPAPEIHPECIICYENTKGTKKSPCCKQFICKECHTTWIERIERCPHCKRSILDFKSVYGNHTEPSICKRHPLMIRLVGVITYIGMLIVLVVIITL